MHFVVVKRHKRWKYRNIGRSAIESNGERWRAAKNEGETENRHTGAIKIKIIYCKRLWVKPASVASVALVASPFHLALNAGHPSKMTNNSVESINKTVARATDNNGT